MSSPVRSWLSASGRGGAPRPHALGEERQDLRIDVVGLGELPGGAGKVAHLPGVRHDDRQGGRRERGHQRRLVAAGGFQDDERGAELVQLLDEVADAALVVRDGGRGARGALGPDELGLGNVDADEAGGHSGISSGRGLVHAQACGMRGVPRPLFGLSTRRRAALSLTHDLGDPRRVELPPVTVSLTMSGT